MNQANDATAANHATPATNSATASASPVAASNIYHERRARLLAQLRADGGGIAILGTAPEVARNRDNTYPYRHDSYFYYLTGFDEPHAWLVLDADADAATRSGDTPGARAPASILFCRPKNAERETWEGVRYGPEAARAAFGFDAAFAVDELDTRIPRLIANARALHYVFGALPEFDARLRGWLAAVRAQGRNGTTAPARAHDLLARLDEMRLLKDSHELDIMRRAARISALAHRRALRACRPGLHEYELEAELLYEFRRHGAQSPAYGSIVATGANACILHYPAGAATLGDGDLVLIDAACELDGYASDITRTFPANGRFSGPQRALYEIVLAAQQAAIDATRAGTGYDVPHQAALAVLAQGMLDTKLLDPAQYSGVADVIERRAYARFYMHRTGHWLGMDVHDCGSYHDLQASPEPDGARPWRALQPGMTLTVEPGLYVRPGDDVPQEYWNIGIRIEDDAVVTAGECELLTRDVPVAIADIEALMRERP
jgi:Xaa-Pro aminopeptidase